MIRSFRVLAALVCSAALLVAANAQQPPKPAAGTPPEIERSKRQRELDSLIGDLQR